MEEKHKNVKKSEKVQPKSYWSLNKSLNDEKNKDILLQKYIPYKVPQKPKYQNKSELILKNNHTSNNKNQYRSKRNILSRTSTKRKIKSEIDCRDICNYCALSESSTIRCTKHNRKSEPYFMRKYQDYKSEVDRNVYKKGRNLSKDCQNDSLITVRKRKSNPPRRLENYFDQKKFRNLSRDRYRSEFSRKRKNGKCKKHKNIKCSTCKQQHRFVNNQLS